MISYKLKDAPPGKMLVLPADVVKYMPMAGENELKIILYLFDWFCKEPERDSFDETDIAAGLAAIGIDKASLISGIAFWRGAGILESVNVKSPAEEKRPAPVFDGEKKPSYSSGELADAAETNASFRELAEYAQIRLKKAFNQSEIATLYSFIDYLKMPSDVVMLAIEHCVSEGKSSLRYIEKMLIDLCDREIDTYEKAEEYILARRKYKLFEGKVRIICGIGERSLTAKERPLVSAWCNFDFSAELVEHAYEQTMAAISKANLSYMNTILLSWQNAGYKTVQEVKAQKKAGDKSGSSSFDLDEFFQKAVNRSRKRIKTETQN